MGAGYMGDVTLKELTIQENKQVKDKRTGDFLNRLITATWITKRAEWKVQGGQVCGF